MRLKRTLLTTAVALSTSMGSAQAVQVNYGWTGLFTMINPEGAILVNSDSTYNSGFQTEISGTIGFDTDTGAGTATIDPFNHFGGGPTFFYDITLQAIGDGNGGAGTLVQGNMLWDWSGTSNISVDIVLDAAGFFSSPDFATAAAVGDAVTLGPDAIGNSTGSVCTYFHATYGCLGSTNADPAFMATVDGNPYAAEDVTILGYDWDYSTNNWDIIFSGNRHTDGIAGIAVDNGPFPGFSINLDIHTMTGIVVAPVPVPAAVWLFGSGLIGLIGVAKRKKS